MVDSMMKKSEARLLLFLYRKNSPANRDTTKPLYSHETNFYQDVNALEKYGLVEVYERLFSKPKVKTWRLTMTGYMVAEVFDKIERIRNGDKETA